MTLMTDQTYLQSEQYATSPNRQLIDQNPIFAKLSLHT